MAGVLLVGGAGVLAIAVALRVTELSKPPPGRVVVTTLRSASGSTLASAAPSLVPRPPPPIDRGLDAAWQRVRERFPSAADRTLIAIDIQRQTLYLLRQGGRAKRWPVSTSVHGIDRREGSYGTPIGVFRIARKIGAGLPPGEILRDERPTGRIATPVVSHDDLAASHWVTTRILWLSGSEPGWNEGGDFDTFLRHIYIHGTANIGMLGKPASEGCIQMAPSAAIALFRRVRVGTPVLIIPGGGDLASIPGLRRAG